MLETQGAEKRANVSGDRLEQVAEVTNNNVAGEQLENFGGGIVDEIVRGKQVGGIANNNIRSGVHAARTTNKSADIARIRGTTTYVRGTERAEEAAEAARTRTATWEGHIVVVRRDE
jgi:hypothetical protein